MSERIEYVQLWPHHLPIPDNARVSEEDTGPHARHAVLIEWIDAPQEWGVPKASSE